MTSSTTPTPSPTAVAAVPPAVPEAAAAAGHNNKYDRQLRLWGAVGQERLAATNVVLVNASSAAGTEVLKNLVLPGIGRCLVMGDDEDNNNTEMNETEIMDTVTGNAAVLWNRNLGSNFFCPHSSSVEHSSSNSSSLANSISNHSPSHPKSMTMPRAQIVAQYLQELNDDVQCDFLHVPNLQLADYHSVFTSLSSTLDSSSQPLYSTTTLVVASDVDPLVLTRVAEACTKLMIPLLIVQAYGLVGLVRIQLPSAAMVWPILDPKLNNVTTINHSNDILRLSEPFPALQTLALAAYEEEPVVEPSAPAAEVVPMVVEDPDPLVDAAPSSSSAADAEAETSPSSTGGVVPYPILLLQALRVWTNQQPQAQSTSSTPQHLQSLPQTSEEKQAFQAILRQQHTSGSNRNHNLPLNVQEALQNAYLVYASSSSSSASAAKLQEWARLRSIVSKAKAALEEEEEDEKEKKERSWLKQQYQHLIAMLHALEAFYKNHCRTPVHGAIPDMTASTHHYVALQRVYQQQARDDVQTMKRLLMMNRVDRARDDQGITIFCQNIQDMDVLELYSPLPNGMGGGSVHSTKNEIGYGLALALSEAVDEDDDNEDDDGEEPTKKRSHQLPLLWGLGVMACQLFFSKHGGRYPGAPPPSQTESGTAFDWEADIELLHTCILEVVEHYQLQDHALIQQTLSLRDNDNSSRHRNAYAWELTRYGNAEIHSIAALIGGVASQEAVKLITGQYVPLNNTYIYNGITSSGGVYRL